MADLIGRLRAFEGSDELGNGDFSLLTEAATEIERLRAEVTALQRELGALHMHAKQRDQYAVEKAVQALDWKKRAEQLEEVLREAQPFIGWTGSYPELHAKIDALLRDQEEGK